MGWTVGTRGHPAGRVHDCRPKTTGKPDARMQAWEVILNRRSWPSQMPGTAGPVSTLVDAAQPLLPGRGG